MPKKKHPKDMTTEEALKHIFHPKIVKHVKAIIRSTTQRGIKVTIEERVFIEAGDLVEMEIACTAESCGGRASFSLTKNGIQLPYACPSCSTEWFHRMSDSRKEAIVDFFDALRRLRELKNPAFKLRLRLHEERYHDAVFVSST